MSEDARPRDVADARELVGLTELVGIRHVLVHGVHVQESAGRPTEPRTSMSIQARGDTGELETRVRIDITLADADISAEVAVLYRFAEELTVPEAVVTEFVERVSVMAAFPYVRESVSTTASRLGVAPPVLGMLRAGEFQVERTPEAPRDEPIR